MAKPVELEETREAVALFHDEPTLQAAIDELMLAGFDRAELSLLGAEEDLRRTFGERFKSSADLEDLDGVPRSSYYSIESMGDAQGGLIAGLIYIGAVAATAIVASTGAGIGVVLAACVLSGGTAAAIGAFFADRIGEARSRQITEHLARGGLLLWVRTWTLEEEKKATTILKKHCGDDVHVHGKRDS